MLMPVRVPLAHRDARFRAGSAPVTVLPFPAPGLHSIERIKSHLLLHGIPHPECPHAPAGFRPGGAISGCRGMMNVNLSALAAEPLGYAQGMPGKGTGDVAGAQGGGSCCIHRWSRLPGKACPSGKGRSESVQVDRSFSPEFVDISLLLGLQYGQIVEGSPVSVLYPRGQHRGRPVNDHQMTRRQET